MKFLKLILSTSIFALLLISCQEKEVKEKGIIFSGITKSLNAEKGLQLLNLKFKPIDTIQINELGEIQDTISVVNGMYYLAGDRFFTALYLENDYELGVQDADSLMKVPSIVFSGIGAEENNYLLKKTKESDRNLKMALGRSGEKEELGFVSLVDSIHAERKLFLEKHGGKIGENLRDLELENFKYERLVSLSRYQGARQRFTKDYDYRISDSFPEIFVDKEINDPSKLGIPEYRSYIKSFFDAETWNVTKDMKDSDWVFEYVKQVQEKVSNKEVKDFFAKGILEYEFAGSEKIEDVYPLLDVMLVGQSEKKELKNKYDRLLGLAKGKPSPDFSFENESGDMMSLKDFRGKLIYMDLWATWCGPCLVESPYFEKLKNEYKGKDIAFVSVCVWDQKPNWEKYLEGKKDGLGVDLFVENPENSFVKDYMVKGIPRFILIDKEGNIINKNAKRPSVPEIKDDINQYL